LGFTRTGIDVVANNLVPILSGRREKTLRHGVKIERPTYRARIEPNTVDQTINKIFANEIINFLIGGKKKRKRKERR